VRALGGGVLAAALLAGCPGQFDPISPPGDPFEDVTPPPAVTPGPPVVVSHPRTPTTLRHLDGGFVATNEGHSWAALQAMAGAEPFPLASVIEVEGSLREWLLPADGSQTGDAAAGTWAGYVAEALAAERYVALRLTALTPEDLPAAWPTTEDPPGTLPDGRLSLLVYGDGPGDDDDAGDDDDSAGDDDDSAGGAPGDDDDTSVVRYVDWSDPDFFQLHGGVVQALADRFADEPGIAFVTVGGVGLRGLWTLPDEVPPVGAGGVFTPGSWLSVVGLHTEVYRGAFPDIPVVAGLSVLDQAGDQQGGVDNTLSGDAIGLRDACFGGCLGAVDWDRFPGEPGTPFGGDPYGGWWPGGRSTELVLGGGQGSLGGWRVAELAGTWDGTAWGTPAEHLDRALQIAATHAPARWVSLGDDACLSAQAQSATATDDCAPATGTWTALERWTFADGERLAVGARVELREVTVPDNWRALDAVPVGLTIENIGMVDGADRPWELRLRAGEQVLAATTAEPGAVAAGATWEGEASATWDADVPDGPVVLEVRVPEERAFGGVMALTLPVGADGWSLAATLE